MINIYPAIDLSGGQVVRLVQGDYNQKTVYADDPAQIARQFKASGAANLHVVDLDGAKDGTTANYDAVRSIVGEGGLFTELGGGIRDEARIYDYLNLGVDRVILGTVAVRDFPFVEEMARKYGGAIAVGVDAKDGQVAVSGWLEETDIPAVEFCEKCRDAGVQTVIYTDIAKDGCLTGTNLEVYEVLSRIEGLNIIASGGVTYAHEVERLNQMGVYGCIIGKALYTGHLNLEEVLKIGN